MAGQTLSPTPSLPDGLPGSCWQDAGTDIHHTTFFLGYITPGSKTVVLNLWVTIPLTGVT